MPRSSTSTFEPTDDAPEFAMNVHINDSSVWRAFEESELTHSAAHYLMTIMHLRRQQGYARVTDVAEHLRVSRGAASRATSLLKERGWIQEDPHRMLELTANGLELARGVQRNYLIVECFLEDILLVPAEIAREDACKMEHLLSPQTTTALFRMIRAMMREPDLRASLAKRLQDAQLACEHTGPCDICHEYGQCLAQESNAAMSRQEDTSTWGKPEFTFSAEVNSAQAGAAATAKRRTLNDLQTGERGKVGRVLGEGSTHRRILDMGISKGVTVEVERVAPLRDPIKVKLRGYSLSLRKSEAALIEIQGEEI
jgi:DtxR family transcriptional regulator, Mn-dependent transcriptional regulator